EGGARGPLRQPWHHRIQPRARREARQVGEGLPVEPGHRRGTGVDHQLRQGAAALPGGERTVLGPQSPGPLGGPRPVKLRSAGTSLLLFALGGCATRAEVVQQDRQYRGMLQDQRRQLQELQHEVERLRADMEEGRGGKGGAGGASEERLAALEQRVSQLEGGARPVTPPPSEAAGGPPPPGPPPPPPPPPPPAPPPPPPPRPPGR